MVKFLTHLFRRKNGRRRLPRRVGAVESMEVRIVPASTHIFVVDGAEWQLSPGWGPGGSIIPFAYSGGTGGTFTTLPSTGLPFSMPPSPGMPPSGPGPNGQWEYFGMGDVDADGDLDLFAKDSGVANINKVAQWWVGKNNNNSFTFGSPWDANVPVFSGTMPITWGDSQVADFTGDGRADVLSRVRETGEWYLWQANATGSGFLAKTLWGTWVTGNEWRDCMVGDFNDDNIADLIGRRVVQTGTVDEWYVGLGTTVATNRGVAGGGGSSSWWSYGTVNHNTTWGNSVVGDFNADGKDDLATRELFTRNSNGSRDGQWTKFLTGSTYVTVPGAAWVTWRQADPNGVERGWRDFQAGDFDGDGTEDLLARTAANEWWFASGTALAGSSPTSVGTWGSQYTVTVGGDFDGNGRVDLAVRNTSDKHWYISWSTGTPGTPPNFSTLVDKQGATGSNLTPHRRRYFVAGDPQSYMGTSNPLGMLEEGGRYNSFPTGTSMIDPHFVIGRYHADGTWNWENFGGGVPLVGKNINYQLHGDFNGDQLIDTLVGVLESGLQKWYIALNKGNAYVTTLTNQSWPQDEYRQVYFSDFSGDGQADILSQHVIDDTAEWYLHAVNATGTDFLPSAYNVLSMTSTANDGWLSGGEIGNFNGGLAYSDHSDDLAICLPNQTDPVYDVLVAWSVPFSSATPPGSVSWSVSVAFTRPLNVWSTLAYGMISMIDQDLLIDDVDGNGVEDIVSLQQVSVIVGPPELTLPCAELWVGQCGPGGPITGSEWSLITDGVDFVALPQINRRTIGRFNGPGTTGIDNLADVALEYNGKLNVWQSTGSSFGSSAVLSVSWYSPITGEKYPLVGDIDNDGFEDIVWPGTTGDIPVTMMVRSTIAGVNPTHTGTPTLYLPPYWVGASVPRLRRRLT